MLEERLEFLNLLSHSRSMTEKKIIRISRCIDLFSSNRSKVHHCRNPSISESFSCNIFVLGLHYVLLDYVLTRFELNCYFVMDIRAYDNC